MRSVSIQKVNPPAETPADTQRRAFIVNCVPAHPDRVPASTRSATLDPHTLRVTIWVIGAAYGIVALCWPPTSRAATTVADVLFFFAGAGVAVAAMTAARVAAPGSRLRQSWTAFAAAFAISPLAMLSLLYRDLFAWGDVLPSLPRALYLLGYVAYWVGIAKYPVDLPTAPASAARRIDDAIAAAVGIAVVCILGSTWLQGAAQDAITRVTTLAFPLCDLASMYLLARRLDRVQDPSRRRALLWLSAALPFDLVVDLFYSELLRVGPVVGAMSTALAYCIPFACIAQAAWLSTRQTRGVTVARSAPIPFAPTMAVAAMWAIVAAMLTGVAVIPLPFLLVSVGGVTALVVLRQLIALRDANAALAARDAAEARFAALVEHSVDATVLLDARGIVTFASPSVHTLLGITPQAMVGRPVSEIVVAEQREQASAVFVTGHRTAMRAATKSWQVNRSDGTIRTVEVAIADRRRDPALRGWLLSARDVTERMALQAHLRERQTLEVVGRMAGGIAHDFNNLLAVVRGNAELIDLDPTATASHGIAHRIIDAADRGAALTRRLLGFTRQDTDAPRVVSLDTIVAGVRPLIERLVAKEITVIYQHEAGEAPLLVDPVEIERAVLNLALNARDAMPSGGTLVIRTTATDNAVQLAVSDTGTGIDTATRARLFEPLFTTKPRGRGTGLGLHITRAAVERAGGSITVDSTVGLGSCFTLTFPRTTTMAIPASSASSTARLPAPELDGRVVLLVDDDESVRNTVSSGLELMGMIVHAADSVDAAEAWLRDSGRGRCDIVVTDMVMPGRSGLELIELVRRRSPSLPILVLSGYLGEHDAGLDAVRGDITMLQKPFAMQQLATMVSGMLPPALSRAA
jgi:two-component system, cell cycle sensor histidine kinase and response regulator CckA